MSDTAKDHFTKAKAALQDAINALPKRGGAIDAMDVEEVIEAIDDLISDIDAEAEEMDEDFAEAEDDE